MTNRKKIALLNMMYDNNYGGNLQRYALVTILQQMGYEVEYLYIRQAWFEDWMRSGNFVKRIYRFVIQVLLHMFHPQKEPWLAWNRESDYYREVCTATEPFLEKYINHTRPIKSQKQLETIIMYGNYDVVIAGSDQIWRKKYVERYGLKTWFLGFLSDNYNGKRIIYGASFGVDNNEYTDQEIEDIRPLFERLTAVSVREKGGLELLRRYGWLTPSAQLVQDPTLLLSCDSYMKLIDAANTTPGEGDMFCYILDESAETLAHIHEIATERSLNPYIRTISGDVTYSVEQWLRYIRDAKFVYTDSYHGFLFSIIFHKPYYVAINHSRGASRFQTVMESLGVSSSNYSRWKDLEKRLYILQNESLNFLQQALQ